MNNLYLIEGENDYLIDKEINKIISKYKNIDIIKYNLEEKNINEIIDFLDTYDMFSRLKIVIAYNPPFFTNVCDELNTSKFIKYLNNPSENILIIITKKINNRLKLVKDTINYFKYIQLDSINAVSFIKENLNDYKMDSLTINYFLDIVKDDFNNIVNELEKLKLYKLDEKLITKKDIDLICRKNFENTIFDLIDAIIKQNKNTIIELYNYFLNNGTEVFQILVLLANQIRLIYNVKILAKKSDKEIADILNVKEYPVKIARTKGINYQKKDLLNILYNLGRIDENIKNGKELPNIALLSYILSI